MPARAPAALLAALALSAGAALVPARATAKAEQQQSPLSDQGSSPNYRSSIVSLSPRTRGLELQVLQFSDRLLLRNGTGRTVEVQGYEGEPYARIQANGAVEVNTRSPAYYLNRSFYGNVTVPPAASASARPRWKLVDGTGQFEWHDHRIHWMSPTLPPQVKDKGRRTLIFDWRVPIAVGARRGAVAGQLYWVPQSSQAPTAAIAVGAAIVVLGLAFVLLVRRRRGNDEPGGTGATPARGEAQSGRGEAW